VELCHLCQAVSLICTNPGPVILGQPPTAIAAALRSFDKWGAPLACPSLQPSLELLGNARSVFRLSG
jgi:hypothetical protein